MNYCLSKFYVSVRGKDGSYYKRNSLLSVRTAFDRHLKSPQNKKKIPSARCFYNHLSSYTKTMTRVRLVNIHQYSGAQPGEGSRGSGTPLLGYENDYHFKRKKVSEPPFEIPRDDIFVFEEEQKKSNLKRHHVLYRILHGSIHGASFF